MKITEKDKDELREEIKSELKKSEKEIEKKIDDAPFSISSTLTSCNNSYIPSLNTTKNTITGEAYTLCCTGGGITVS
jgi:hypothetical protein